MLVAGTVGVLFGPSLGRLLERRGSRNGMLLVIVLALVGMVPASMAIPLLPNYVAALSVAGLFAFLYSVPQAMAASMLQLTSPAHMRGLIISIYVMVINIAGLGLAPLLVALLTDVVFGDPAMVGWSLGIVCTTAAVIGTWLALQARRYYDELDPNSDRAPATT